MNDRVIETLFEQAGPVIRYRVARELCSDEVCADACLGALLDSRLAKLWLGRLPHSLNDPLSRATSSEGRTRFRPRLLTPMRSPQERPRTLHPTLERECVDVSSPTRQWDGLPLNALS